MHVNYTSLIKFCDMLTSTATRELAVLNLYSSATDSSLTIRITMYKETMLETDTTVVQSTE